MAHNAAYFQQTQQPVYPQYPQQPHPAPFQPQAQPQQQQQPVPPPNIYQQIGLQQPQPGRVPARPFQDPKYQLHTQLAIQEYQQHYQQPVYAQQYVQQQHYQPAPAMPGPPPPAQPLQRIPSSQSIPAAQSQFQPPQSAYPQATYQPQHPIPQAPPPAPVHAHSQSLPTVPISMNHIATSHGSQVPLASSIPQQIQAPTSMAPQPTPVPAPTRRPLPFVQRGDSLPPLPLDTILASNPPPPFNSPRAIAPTSQQTVPSPQDRGPQIAWNKQMVGRASMEATSPIQSVRPSPAPQITSSFSAGATSTRAQVPPSIGVAPSFPGPQAVKSSSPTRRPLPSPGDGNATKHQSIDLSRFSTSSPIKNSSNFVTNPRSSSPVKFPVTAGGFNPSSRSGSASPTKGSDSPTRILPTPSDQSDAIRRRASPPRWPNAESDRSRSVSPAKATLAESPRVITAISKNPSTPNPSSFAAARSMFSGSNSNSGRPGVSFNQNPIDPPVPVAPVPASLPKKTIPVWKRTIPDPGDGKDIDFIGKSTFNPAQHVDPIIPGSAYAKALARAKVPVSAIQPYGATVRPSVFPIAPPKGYPYGYVPPVQNQGMVQHQRYPNRQEFDDEEDDSDEESQSEDTGSEEARRGRKGRKDKGSKETEKKKGSSQKGKDKSKNDEEKRREKEKEKSRGKDKEKRSPNKLSKSKFRNKDGSPTKPDPRKSRHQRDPESDNSSARSSTRSISASESESDHSRSEDHHDKQDRHRIQRPQGGNNRERGRDEESDNAYHEDRHRSQEYRREAETNPRTGGRDLPSRGPGQDHSYGRDTNGMPRPPPMVRDTGHRGDSNYGYGDDYENRHQRSYSENTPTNTPRKWSADTPSSSRGASSSFTPRTTVQVARKLTDLSLDDAPPVSLRRSPSPNHNGSGFGQRRDMYSQSTPTRFQPQSRQETPTRYHDTPQQHRPSGRPMSMQNSSRIESPAPVGGRGQMADIPSISFTGTGDESRQNYRHSYRSNFDDGNDGPIINVQSYDEPSRQRSRADPPPPKIQVFDIPGISFSEDGGDGGPTISISGPDEPRGGASGPSRKFEPQQQQGFPRHQVGRVQNGAAKRRHGLFCAGCDGEIVGRILSAMGLRWHPDCFRCTICHELLEHVSSYENEGLPYCHLDYHENFAPKCYHCKTAIIEERFISLDDPGLGKRNYHEQHFFCAECGDPFLSPSSTFTGELTVAGDGQFESDDVGFTVYKGHPYCEACHVRLRMPKCKRCKKSIRDGDEAVEALGGKWCWSCFLCAGCQKPFEDPSFFERGGKPFCESCFSIILRNEL